MISLFSLCLLSLLSCILVGYLARKFNLVDRPDGIRKIHQGEVPLGGGIAISLSLSIGFFFIFSINDFFVSSLLLCSLFIVIIGFYDDIKPLPISIRLITQILCSWGVIAFTDVYVTNLGNLFGLGEVYLGQLGIPLTIFMVVGVCNAFNMLDGMDGLVGSMSLFAFLSILILLLGSNHDAMWIFVLSIILLIFLLFNLGLFGRRLKMFLGDSGATFLGFFLAWTLVYLSQGEGTIIKPISAVWLIALPLIDASTIFIIRLNKGKAIFSGDRNHIHHLLLDKGLSNWQVLLVLSIFNLVGCAVTLLSSFYLFQESNLFYGFLTIWIFYFLMRRYPLLRGN